MLDGKGVFTKNRGYLRVGYSGKHKQIFIDNFKFNDSFWWTGSEAIRMVRFLYCNSTRYLKRNVDKVIRFL